VQIEEPIACGQDGTLQALLRYQRVAGVGDDLHPINLRESGFFEVEKEYSNGAGDLLVVATEQGLDIDRALRTS
jgi:hypothetical protein